MQAEDARRLTQLERQNSPLKPMASPQQWSLSRPRSLTRSPQKPLNLPRAH